MFKTKLNQYCQTNTLNIPQYRVTKEGPDHRPRFRAVVVVNGVSFKTGFSRSIKEAENLAAKLAFEHFSVGSLTGSGRSDLRHKPASTSIQRQDTQGTSSIGANRLTEDNNMSKDMRHWYKSQLQTYAQKRNLELPVYCVESVGKCYETKEFFHIAKEAEYAAAKVALDAIIPDRIEKENPFIYKNLLQEILQKERSCLPNYTTVRAGIPHTPTFMSTVEVRGETFRGQEANTKKQAELNVAKVAYIALKKRQSKKDDKLVGATAHVMETPMYSPANVPVFGACNSMKNDRTDVQPMSDKQNKCEGKGLKATPNPLTRMPIAAAAAATTTASGSTQNLKATSPVPGPISYQKTPPSTVMSSQLVGASTSDRMKMKRKLLFLPQSGGCSSEDVKPVIHNQKDLKISPGPIRRAPTNILGQLPAPDPCECPLHSNRKWIALIPKEET
ncbi:hypothetical protein V2J09_018634 [Rumex salicifolius]